MELILESDTESLQHIWLSRLLLRDSGTSRGPAAAYQLVSSLGHNIVVI